jgi:2Fe-2S ferredoxin
MEKKIRLDIENSGQIVHMSQDESVLQAMLRTKQEIPHSCGGFGTCGTCQIIVQEDPDSLPERNEIESEMANDRGFKKSERLACQLIPNKNLKIKIP